MCTASSRAPSASITSRSRSWVSGRAVCDALLLEGDRGGLDGADPDRQVADAVLLAQQHDRLVGRQLDPHPDDVASDARGTSLPHG